MAIPFMSHLVVLLALERNVSPYCCFSRFSHFWHWKALHCPTHYSMCGTTGLLAFFSVSVYGGHFLSFSTKQLTACSGIAMSTKPAANTPFMSNQVFLLLYVSLYTVASRGFAISCSGKRSIVVRTF